MRRLSGLIERFGFTRNEIIVILALVVALLIGLVLRTTREISSEVPAGSKEFDYSLADSIFAERSGALTDRKPTVDSSSIRLKNSRKDLPSLHSININTASKELLMQLPGIGEEYAERIMLYRDDLGPFKTIDDLVKVKGIGKKTLDRLRPYVTLH